MKFLNLWSSLKINFYIYENIVYDLIVNYQSIFRERKLNSIMS